MTTDFDADELNLITLAQEYSDDAKARALLESILWPEGPVCPHCGNTSKEKGSYRIVPKEGSKKPTRPGVYKCAACREHFTVTVGTILEDSHIPISKWLMAFFILCASKKSVSAHQLHRMLKITYKSAWFMAHRIRYALGPKLPLGKLLTGTVEVDETFIGGKGDMRTKYSRKTPVVALVERGGAAHTRVVSNVTQMNLKGAIGLHVAKEAVVNTDESPVYPKALKGFAGHQVVNHSKLQYARPLADGSVAHVNTAESFFSLLKRGVIGSWHHVSRQHLPKYADEFAFRWTHRRTSDGQRTVAALRTSQGKRLTYRQVI